MVFVNVAHDDIEGVAQVPERALAHYADLGWYRVGQDDEGQWARVEAAPQQAAAERSADPAPADTGKKDRKTAPAVVNQEN